MNPRPQRLSAYVLWRVLPLAVIAMAVIAVMILSTTEKMVGKTINERIGHQSTYVSERINQRLFTMLDELTLLAQNDLIVNGLIDAESRDLYLPTFFASLRLGGAVAPRISLVDYKGVELFHNDLPGGPAINRKDWVDALSFSDEVHSLDENGMVIAVPVLVHGLSEGAMVASFPPMAISRLFDTGVSGIDIDIIDYEGKVFYSSGSHDIHGDYEAGDWIEIRHAIPFFPGTTLMTAQLRAEEFGTVQQLRIFLVFTSLAALIALVAAIVYSTYLSSRELGKLSSILGGITRPEHFARRLMVNGPSELQSLGGSFNAMLETLQHSTTSRSYLDNILNSLNEILIVSSPSGEIITLNSEAEKFLADRDLDRNASIAMVIRADRYGADQDPWQFLRLTGETRYLESIYEQENAPFKALLWAKSSLRDEDGIWTGVVYVATDITDRMRMEQMKTEFVSTVSHELRTPLTSILGSIKLVQSGAAGAVSEKSANLLNIAHNNSERLVRLINDILDIQKIEAGQLDVENKPVEICARVKQAVDENAAYAEHHGVSYRIEQPDHEVWIEADVHRLDQILANLMSNAAKFSDPENEVVISVRSGDGDVTISVADTGIGIPEHYQDSIFEKFKQVDASDSRSKGGTGLGLAITHNLVKMMGGDIWLDSAPGQGTTFYVRFPEFIAQDRAANAGA